MSLIDYQTVIERIKRNNRHNPDDGPGSSHHPMGTSHVNVDQSIPTCTLSTPSKNVSVSPDPTSVPNPIPDPHPEPTFLPIPVPLPMPTPIPHPDRSGRYRPKSKSTSSTRRPETKTKPDSGTIHPSLDPIRIPTNTTTPSSHTTLLGVEMGTTSIPTPQATLLGVEIGTTSIPTPPTTLLGVEIGTTSIPTPPTTLLGVEIGTTSIPIGHLDKRDGRHVTKLELQAALISRPDLYNEMPPESACSTCRAGRWRCIVDKHYRKKLSCRMCGNIRCDLATEERRFFLRSAAGKSVKERKIQLGKQMGRFGAAKDKAKVLETSGTIIPFPSTSTIISDIDSTTIATTLPTSFSHTNLTSPFHPEINNLEVLRDVALELEKRSLTLSSSSSSSILPSLPFRKTDSNRLRSAKPSTVIDEISHDDRQTTRTTPSASLPLDETDCTDSHRDDEHCMDQDFIHLDHDEDCTDDDPHHHEDSAFDSCSIDRDRGKGNEGEEENEYDLHVHDMNHTHFDHELYKVDLSLSDGLPMKRKRRTVGMLVESDTGEIEGRRTIGMVGSDTEEKRLVEERTRIGSGKVGSEKVHLDDIPLKGKRKRRVEGMEMEMEMEMGPERKRRVEGMEIEKEREREGESEGERERERKKEKILPDVTKTQQTLKKTSRRPKKRKKDGKTKRKMISKLDVHTSISPPTAKDKDKKMNTKTKTKIKKQNQKTYITTIDEHVVHQVTLSRYVLNVLYEKLAIANKFGNHEMVDSGFIEREWSNIDLPPATYDVNVNVHVHVNVNVHVHVSVNVNVSPDRSSPDVPWSDPTIGPPLFTSDISHPFTSWFIPKVLSISSSPSDRLLPSKDSQKVERWEQLQMHRWVKIYLFTEWKKAVRFMIRIEELVEEHDRSPDKLSNRLARSSASGASKPSSRVAKDWWDCFRHGTNWDKIKFTLNDNRFQSSILDLRDSLKPIVTPSDHQAQSRFLYHWRGLLVEQDMRRTPRWTSEFLSYLDAPSVRLEPQTNRTSPTSTRTHPGGNQTSSINLDDWGIRTYDQRPPDSVIWNPMSFDEIPLQHEFFSNLLVPANRILSKGLDLFREEYRQSLTDRAFTFAVGGSGTTDFSALRRRRHDQSLVDPLSLTESESDSGPSSSVDHITLRTTSLTAIRTINIPLLPSAYDIPLPPSTHDPLVHPSGTTAMTAEEDATPASVQGETRNVPQVTPAYNTVGFIEFKPFLTLRDLVVFLTMVVSSKGEMSMEIWNGDTTPIFVGDDDKVISAGLRWYLTLVLQQFHKYQTRHPLLSSYEACIRLYLTPTDIQISKIILRDGSKSNIERIKQASGPIVREIIIHRQGLDTRLRSNDNLPSERVFDNGRGGQGRDNSNLMREIEMDNRRATDRRVDRIWKTILQVDETNEDCSSGEVAVDMLTKGIFNGDDDDDDDDMVWMSGLISEHVALSQTQSRTSTRSQPTPSQQAPSQQPSSQVETHHQTLTQNQSQTQPNMTGYFTPYLSLPANPRSKLSRMFQRGFLECLFPSYPSFDISSMNDSSDLSPSSSFQKTSPHLQQRWYPLLPTTESSVEPVNSPSRKKSSCDMSSVAVDEDGSNSDMTMVSDGSEGSTLRDEQRSPTLSKSPGTSSVHDDCPVLATVQEILSKQKVSLAPKNEDASTAWKVRDEQVDYDITLDRPNRMNDEVNEINTPALTSMLLEPTSYCGSGRLYQVIRADAWFAGSARPVSVVLKICHLGRFNPGGSEESKEGKDMNAEQGVINAHDLDDQFGETETETKHEINLNLHPPYTRSEAIHHVLGERDVMCGRLRNEQGKSIPMFYGLWVKDDFQTRSTNELDPNLDSTNPFSLTSVNGLDPDGPVSFRTRRLKRLEPTDPIPGSRSTSGMDPLTTYGLDRNLKPEAQALESISNLHDRGVIHGDIRARHLLVRPNHQPSHRSEHDPSQNRRDQTLGNRNLARGQGTRQDVENENDEHGASERATRRNTTNVSSRSPQVQITFCDLEGCWSPREDEFESEKKIEIDQIQRVIKSIPEPSWFVLGQMIRRHDPLAPEPLDFHETSIEFDPTCDLVVVFPVPLQVEESALRTLGRIGGYCMLTRGKARKMIPEKEELEQGLVPEEEIPTSSSRSTISHDLTSTTTTPDPLNELSQQLSQLLAIMTMQQKEQNALREELATMKADRQNQQILTSKGASLIEVEENKPCLEPKLTNNERTGRTRCADPPTFSGERGELDNFLAACHMNFEFKGAEYATDRRKILFMYGYLRGTPQMLITPAITNPMVVVNNTDPRTKSDWIYFKQHVIGTEENQRMAETMIAANRWAARRKNETTWLPPRSNSMRLDTSPPNPVERHSQSTGRGPLPGGKPGMMNYGLPNDPPVTWTEDGGRLSENEMTWRRENRRCLKCRSPEHYANNCPNGGNTRNNIRGSPNPHSSPIPSGSNSIPTGSKGPLVRGMAVTFEEEGNEYLA
ncbi:hypothetical protein TREMEDRAFT_65246 [Tremella mesenterica DSM 1558]|uniref:uncharacterized protein n=1 Tax=Tremella mesenterica (strain ATCC 24925 / CBS 8224 / DSM 1558 / NBRC 9311 / NRRL Y-6157 / RJB 2259-6 / UBC 559-6) TaxID=578456 RepID=UPI00032BEBA4|nr:uncharacterized protein TREMEDRAFT_65246 [Tremella mesenterica DSM 1558]EIW66840.1 hypothetical protein TREMEDRAFT_65246 [Tremella mesenterica DSM 1558]